MANGQQEVVLDERRRTSLAKVGRKSDTHYLVEEFDDGTVMLVPAVTISAHELAVLRSPELREALEAAAPGKPRPPLVSRGSFAQYADDDLDEELTSSGG